MAEEGFDEGAFADAVRAEQGDDLAGGEREADAAQDRRVAIGEVKGGGLKEGVHRRAIRSDRSSRRERQPRFFSCGAGFQPASPDVPVQKGRLEARTTKTGASAHGYQVRRRSRYST